MMREKFEALLAKGDEGDWIGVFECEALDSSMLGFRFAMLFDAADFDTVEIGRTHAPDTQFGLGWKFLLKARCRTAGQAMEWFAEEDE